MNEDGSGITVNMTKGICKNNETCVIGIGGVDRVYEFTSVNATCQSDPEITTRFPGEECKKDADCFTSPDTNSTGVCDAGKCKGVADKGNCTSDVECLVGFYCSEKTCTKQKAEGEACTDLWGCANNLLCYKKKCVQYGSLKNGDGVTIDDVGGDLTNFNQLCEFGLVNNDKCVQSNYTATTAAKMDKNGYVPCNWGEECEYTITTSTERIYGEKCGCGYNEKGQGYCRLPGTQQPDSWKKLIKAVGSSAKNQCHSRSRFNCYKSNAAYTNEYVKSTVNAHLYYGAVDCAQEVLGASYIQYSLAVIMIALAFIF